ncbi:hypothetical protein BT69DRAFT_1292336 [Atractiella rhizophila]|nr:hypothetical protein BT69DRAFT_1292336 [Atractiella rhizophila]
MDSAEDALDWVCNCGRYCGADLAGIDGSEEEDEGEIASNSEDAATTAPEGVQDPIKAILTEVEWIELRRLIHDGFARPAARNKGEEEPRDDLLEKDLTDPEERLLRWRGGNWADRSQRDG